MEGNAGDAVGGWQGSQHPEPRHASRGHCMHVRLHARHCTYHVHAGRQGGSQFFMLHLRPLQVVPGSVENCGVLHFNISGYTRVQPHLLDYADQQG